MRAISLRPGSGNGPPGRENRRMPASKLHMQNDRSHGGADQRTEANFSVGVGPGS